MMPEAAELIKAVAWLLVPCAWIIWILRRTSHEDCHQEILALRAENSQLRALAKVPPPTVRLPNAAEVTPWTDPDPE